MGGVQGTAPDAGIPRPPSPPGVNQGFTGRPAEPERPQAPAPLMDRAPAGPWGGGPASPPQAPAAPPAIQISIPSPGGGAPTDGGISSRPPTPGGVTAGPAAVQFPKLPRRSEVAGLPPGTQAMTPFGPVVVGPDGSPSVQLTPEGKILFAQEKTAMQGRFGAHPFAGDPNAPQPNLTPGRRFYNPFTGEYGD